MVFRELQRRNQLENYTVNDRRQVRALDSVKSFPHVGKMVFRERQRRSQLENYTVNDRRRMEGYKRSSLADSLLGGVNLFLKTP